MIQLYLNFWKICRIWLLAIFYTKKRVWFCFSINFLNLFHKIINSWIQIKYELKQNIFIQTDISQLFIHSILVWLNVKLSLILLLYGFLPRYSLCQLWYSLKLWRFNTVKIRIGRYAFFTGQTVGFAVTILETDVIKKCFLFFWQVWPDNRLLILCKFQLFKHHLSIYIFYVTYGTGILLFFNTFYVCKNIFSLLLKLFHWRYCWEL